MKQTAQKQIMKTIKTSLVALMLTLLMSTMTVPTLVLAVGEVGPVKTTNDLKVEKSINKIFKIEDITIDGKEGNKALKNLSGQIKSNKEATFSDVFSGIIKILTGVAVIGTFVGAIVAGIFLLFSAGEEGRQEKAKNILLYVAIGDVIIAVSYAIVRGITLIKPIS